MTEPNRKFAVCVERSYDGTHDISITTNGYQFFGLPISVEDPDKAELIRAFLELALKPDTDRIYNRYVLAR
jgi:hypothetical protein